MEDLIKANDWKMETQNFLEIKNSDLQLSIIPEYIYWMRDENGLIYKSKHAVGVKLNICIQKGYKQDDGSIWYKNEMFIELGSEEEFYDFMIGIQKEFTNKSESV